MNFDPSLTVLDGQFGQAFRVELPAGRPDTAETVCSWVITSPIWHPAWSQYNLFVVRLRFGVPGFPDPKLRFVGATHELEVVALNPEHGPYTQQLIVERDYTLPWLQPINISEQFTATDAEMEQLAGLCVLGVLNGVLNPETSILAPSGLAPLLASHPGRIREAWLTSMVRTLAHIRGEEHAL